MNSAYDMIGQNDFNVTLSIATLFPYGNRLFFTFVLAVFYNDNVFNLYSLSLK